MRPHSWILVSVAALTASLPGPVRGDSPVRGDAADVCVDAYEKSQVLMKSESGQSTLLPARQMLRTCLRSDCKEWMLADCSRWLSEVETRIPTVVFSARDTSGRDLTEIVVTTADGASVASRLDGRSIEIEPGRHVFVFLAPDGARREKTVLVLEGEKDQSVSALFDGPPDEMNRVVAAPDATATRAGTPALRYLGYGVTGTGGIGLGVGAIFVVEAIMKKNEANCNPSTSTCDSGTKLDEARSAARISAVSFVYGAALVAGGVSVLLFGPKSSPVQARLGVGPARLDLTGSF